jgi:redox-sensitive bicupin YhaK (pirin superfamily)
MATLRTIDGIFRGAPHHWVGDGFRVRNYFPNVNPLTSKVSPFYFLDYHEPHAYPSTENLRRGVGPHPHRGLETVTIAIEGAVAHHDSAGNSGVIHPGEVQWMTAGAGILHKEYHEAAFARQGGVLHMIQLWVNLPKAHKMTPPKYQALTHDQIKVVELPSQGGIVRVIAGIFEGVRGPASTFSPIDLFEVRLAEGGIAKFSFPEGHNTSCLMIKGKGRVNGGHPVEASDLIVFQPSRESFTLEGVGSGAAAIIMSGEPIREPLASHGPFLMNTKEEIHRAFEDYAAGKFGTLDP